MQQSRKLFPNLSLKIFLGSMQVKANGGLCEAHSLPHLIWVCLPHFGTTACGFSSFFKLGYTKAGIDCTSQILCDLI